MLSAAKTTFSLQKAAGLGAVAAGGYFASRSMERTTMGQAEGPQGASFGGGLVGGGYSIARAGVLNEALGGTLTSRGGLANTAENMLTGGLGGTATVVGMGAGAVAGAGLGVKAAMEGMAGFEAPSFSTQSAPQAVRSNVSGMQFRAAQAYRQMGSSSRARAFISGARPGKAALEASGSTGLRSAGPRIGNAASSFTKGFGYASMVLGGAALGAEAFGAFASRVAESVERAHGQLPADEEEMMPRRTRGSGAGAGVVTSGRRYAKPQVTGGMVHDLHKTGGTGGVLT